MSTFLKIKLGAMTTKHIFSLFGLSWQKSSDVLDLRMDIFRICFGCHSLLRCVARMRQNLLKLLIGPCEEELTSSWSQLLENGYLKVCDIQSGEHMKRTEAIAFLREITSDQTVIPAWVSLENANSDECELHIKPQSSDSSFLKPIFKEHNLTLKEVGGFWIIYEKRGVHKRTA